MRIRKYVGILLNIMIPLAELYLVCFWGPRLLAFFMPFVIGWIVAMIANPLIRLLERKLKIVRKHSSVILVVGVLALVITGLFWLTRWGVRELAAFVRALPGLFDGLQEEVSLAYQSLSGILNFVPEEVEASFGQFMGAVGGYIGGLLQNMAASFGGAVARSIPDLFIYMIVVLMSSYLFLAEHDSLTSELTRRIPRSVRKYSLLLRKDIRRLIRGYFLAQFKIMFVVAVVLFAGFLILGVHYSAALAVGIAFLDFLPMFGTGTALIPWAAVKLFTGEYAYAFGLALIYVLTQAIRQIIQPKIVGDSMGLSPLATLFFLYLGYKFRGIAGMILAVPLGMILIRFYEYGMFDSFLENCRLLLEEIRKLRREREPEEKRDKE